MLFYLDSRKESKKYVYNTLEVLTNNDLNFNDWYTEIKRLSLTIKNTNIVEVDGVNISDLFDDEPARNAYKNIITCKQYAIIL